jgi:beta-glucanase (GH16 family)
MKKNLFITALTFLTLISCQEQDSAEIQIAEVTKPQTKGDSSNNVSRAAAATLIWEDNFDGNTLDTNVWYRQEQATKWVTGTDGQTYTLRTSTAAADSWVSNGSLKLEIRKNNATDYSRVYLRTLEAKARTYGYYEARIWMPLPYGFQGAFWMMPTSMAGMDCSSSSCPELGTLNSATDGAELDIIEGTGGQISSDFRYSTNVHIDGYYTGHPSNWVNTYTYNHPILAVDNIYNRYHTYGFHWTSTFLRWYIDGYMIREVAIDKWIPDVNEWIILSTSVHPQGDWDGTFDATKLPATMYVDWVKVYNTKP